MIIFPAIDLKDGKCVRLQKGDFDTAHKVAEDALETATAFTTAGARFIHMVDLDGALAGTGKNRDIVARVAGGVDAQVELGGGIRSMADAAAALELGVSRVIIGSAAVSDPDFVRQAVARYGDRVAVGIDARDGRVSTHGWTADSGIDAIDFAKTMEGYGVKTIIFTDIGTDGMLQGPAFDRLAALGDAVGCDIVASGGVTTIEDVRRLRDMGLYGAIIGKAYYAGTIDLARAVEEAGDQC